MNNEMPRHKDRLILSLKPLRLSYIPDRSTRLHTKVFPFGVRFATIFVCADTLAFSPLPFQETHPRPRSFVPPVDLRPTLMIIII